jgi:hypothetical protein
LSQKKSVCKEEEEEPKMIRDLVQNYVIDTTYWTGPNPTWNQVYATRIFAVVALGTLYAFLFKLLYVVCEQLSFRFFRKYKSLNAMQKVDWTSRLVAMVFIVVNTYQAYLLIGEGHHTIVPVEGTDPTDWDTAQWRLDTTVTDNCLYLLYLYYSFVFAYELYDLKNCWDIRMMSGVLHHIVLLIIIPLNWPITLIAIPGVWMTVCTYFTNIPAHIRSFMVHMGYRDTKFYTYNKWAWWISYIVFRLFGIPWFSSVMWFTIAPMKAQSPLLPIVYYFAAMAVHYSLSLYWFVEMTKTMFPVSREMKRVGSYALVPKIADKPKHNRGGESESESGEDEGGQKFD